MRFIILWLSILFLLGTVCESFLCGFFVNARDSLVHHCAKQGSAPDLKSWLDYVFGLSVATIVTRGVAFFLFLFKMFHVPTDEALDFSTWGRLVLIIVTIIPFSLYVLLMGSITGAPYDLFHQSLPLSGQNACISLHTDTWQALGWTGFAGSAAFVISLFGVGTRGQKHKEKN